MLYHLVGQQRKEEGPGGRQARRKEPTTPEGVVGGGGGGGCNTDKTPDVYGGVGGRGIVIIRYQVFVSKGMTIIVR